MRAFLFTFLVLGATASSAQSLVDDLYANAIPDPVADHPVTEVFGAISPETKIVSIEPSPIAGIDVITLSDGQRMHATTDGGYLVTGDLYRISVERGFENLTELSRAGDRIAVIETLRDDDLIVFSPKGEIKASVVVFTDVDCFYCQKLHSERETYLAKGIQIKYAAYPRSGLESESGKKIVSAWCSDDPQSAITALKERQSIPENLCAGNPVSDQLEMVGKLGIHGTPGILTVDGQLLPGYMPADDLAQSLGI